MKKHSIIVLLFLCTLTMFAQEQMDIPCLKESMNMDGESIGALGVAEYEMELPLAILHAQQYAEIELGKTLDEKLSTINAFYEKETGESLSADIVEKVAKMANAYTQKVCMQYYRDSEGAYEAFVALRLPINPVINCVVGLTDESQKESVRTISNQVFNVNK